MSIWKNLIRIATDVFVSIPETIVFVNQPWIHITENGPGDTYYFESNGGLYIIGPDGNTTSGTWKKLPNIPIIVIAQGDTTWSLKRKFEGEALLILERDNQTFLLINQLREEEAVVDLLKRLTDALRKISEMQKAKKALTDLEIEAMTTTNQTISPNARPFRFNR